MRVISLFITAKGQIKEHLFLLNCRSFRFFFQVMEVSISTKSTFLRCVWVSRIVHPDWKRPPPHFCDVFVWYFMLDFKNNIKQCLRFNNSVEVERHSYNFLLLSWLWAYNNRKENCKIWSLTNKTPISYSFTVLANHLKLNFHFCFISFCIPKLHLQNYPKP